jgi:predicted DNA binding CopG/RHH family protein
MTPAGRPEIGQPINIRLSHELLAAVDAKAGLLKMSRAKLIRTILTRQLLTGG